MSQLKILDTGYIDATTALGSQTQLSVSNRAGYDGTSDVNAFTLDANATITRSRSISIENKPIINTLTNVGTSIVTAKNEVFTISMILAKSIVTAGYNTTKLTELLRLEVTRGLKLLYVSATGDELPTIVEDLGRVNLAGTFSDASPSDTNGTVATTMPYLIGRVTNMSVSDSSTNNSYWRISFNFEVTG